MTKFFGLLLLVEFVVVALAPIIFVSVPSRLLAGIIAGAIFTAFGVFVVMVGVQNKPFRRTATFWAGCLHLFGSALPMVITRMINFSRGFEDVHVLGLPGPVFHNVATVIFAVLMLATGFDLVVAWRKGRAVGRR